MPDSPLENFKTYVSNMLYIRDLDYNLQENHVRIPLNKENLKKLGIMVTEKSSGKHSPKDIGAILGHLTEELKHYKPRGFNFEVNHVIKNKSGSPPHIQIKFTEKK